MKFNLSELVKILNGYAFKSADIVSDQSVYVIKIKNIQSSKILLEKDSMTAEVDGLNKYQIKFNDILISLTGSGMNQMSSAVGKVGRFRHTQKAYLNQRVAKISSLDETKLTNDYLYYFINRPEIQKDLVSVATGSANQVNISPKIIGELSIDLPDLAEQERITNMLTALDSKIEILESINDNLVALAGTIWHNFDVYESKEVRDLFDVKYGKTMPKTQLTSTGVPVFGANGMIGYTDKPVMLPDYSVVITSRGSGSGDVQLIDKGVFVTNNLLTIESKHSQSNWATWQMLEQANIQGAVTGSAQPQLTIENFARVVVNIPDKDTIQKFNEVSENFEQIYWANKNEIKLLTETRDTLLQKLIG